MMGVANLFFTLIISRLQCDPPSSVFLGTTIGFIAFSQNQKIARKVKTFFALAPVAKVGHVKGAIEVLSTIEPEVEVCSFVTVFY